MPDDETERPSLEAPQLFSRRRNARKQVDDTAVFDDSGTDVPAPVVAGVDTDDADDADDAAPGAPRQRGRRRRPVVEADGTSSTTERGSLPALSGRLALPALAPQAASALCGALAGLSLVVFVWLGFRGCEALRGTSSCGTAPGMLALTLIFVLSVIVGALLLRAFHLPEPGASSFLGIGVTAVIALVVLIDALDHWSMVLVIPAISAATFLGSWWLTTTYIDPSAD